MSGEAREALQHSGVPQSDVPIVQTLIEQLLQKLTNDQEVHFYLKRRADLMLWVGLAMLLVLALGASLRIYNYSMLRASVEASNQELADSVKSLKSATSRIDRLRFEAGLKDARYASVKGLAENGGVERSDIGKIQTILDNYAGSFTGEEEVPTYDAAKREACIALKAGGYQCQP